MQTQDELWERYRVLGHEAFDAGDQTMKPALARLVEEEREKERDACERLAHDIRDWTGGSTGNAEGTGQAIAAAIRARAAGGTQ